MRILRHLAAIAALPTMAAVVLPGALVLGFGPATIETGPAGEVLSATLGALALITGLTLLVWTILLFDRVGDGTLAPWDAPKRLVLRGPYRHVRNPMISGVLFVLAAEALILRSPVLGTWFLIFLAINQTYIPLWEEKSLSRRFGADYAAYKQHVRRWLPRLRAWRGNDTAA